MPLRAVSGITRAQAAQLQVATRRAAGGRWMTFGHVGSAISAADQLQFYWMPDVDGDRPVTLLATRCQTGGAGSAVKFGIWRNNPETGRPTGLPVISQNAGLSTATSGTWQDLVVANVRVGSPSGWWFAAKFTGTLPSMICSLNSGSQSFAMSWPIGSRPTVPRGVLTVADAYANDIGAFDATSALFAEAAIGPACFYVEYA